MRFSRSHSPAVNSQWAVLSCLVSVSVSLLSTGCYPTSKISHQARTSVQVEVVEVCEQSQHDTIRLIGKIEPTLEVTMCFEVSGVVKQVNVSEGSEVQQGDPIATLFPEDYQLALQQANSRRDVAKARLDLHLAGTRREERDAAQAELNRTEALQKFWDPEYIRLENLFNNSKVVTESELQQARSQRDAAVAAQLAAKAKYDLALNGPRKEEIAEARAAYQVEIEAVTIASRQLAKASLKTPFAGRVEKRFVDPGAFVSVFPTGGVPVVQIIDLSHAEAVVSVPESLLHNFKKGGELHIASAWHEGQLSDAANENSSPAIGTIISVGQIANPTTGTYEVRARLPNAKRQFTVGMVVIATLESPQSNQEIRVPVSAVRYAFGQSPYVFTISPESQLATNCKVTLGSKVANHFVVTKGLQPGDLVVVAGHHRVVDGDRVEFKKSNPLLADDTLQP